MGGGGGEEGGGWWGDSRGTAIDHRNGCGASAAIYGQVLLDKEKKKHGGY